MGSGLCKRWVSVSLKGARSNLMCFHSSFIAVTYSSSFFSLAAKWPISLISSTRDMMPSPNRSSRV